MSRCSAPQHTVVATQSCSQLPTARSNACYIPLPRLQQLWVGHKSAAAQALGSAWLHMAASPEWGDLFHIVRREVCTDVEQSWCSAPTHQLLVQDALGLGPLPTGASVMQFWFFEGGMAWKSPAPPPPPPHAPPSLSFCHVSNDPTRFLKFTMLVTVFPGVLC